MPEEFFSKLKKNIRPQWKICFFSALVLGLIAHLYRITNWIPNWDSLVFRYDPQNMINMGRWFLPVVCTVSSFYDLPFLNGIIAILTHSLGAVCVCRIFKIKKPVTAFFTGAIIATFPTVTSVMMYSYVADGYALAFLGACLAAKYLVCEKPRYTAAVILIALSTAIYQAYITVTISILLLHLINELIFDKEKLVNTVKKGLKFLIVGIIGMLVYYFILTLLGYITNTEFIDYQGFESSVSANEIDLISSLKMAIYIFRSYFWDFSKGFNLFSILNSVMLVCVFFGYMVCIRKNKAYCTLSKRISILAVAGIFPIGVTVLTFMNDDIDYHNIMKMGYCFIYIFFILLYERPEIYTKKKYGLNAWLICSIAFVIVFNNILIANIAYHKAQISYEKSYATLVRISDRIEQTENHEKCSKLLIIGSLPGSEDYEVHLPPDVTGVSDGYILRADDPVVNQSVVCSAINDYCGKNYTFLAGKEKQLLMTTNDTVKKMDLWPAKTSVAVVDDVIVIKLGAEER